MNYLPSILFIVCACWLATKAAPKRTPSPTPWQRAESRRIMAQRRIDTSAGIAAVWCLNAQLKAQEQRRLFSNN